MGMVGLDPFDMKLLLETDPDDCDSEEEREDLLMEQRCARLLLPFLEDHHRLLVTLLLVNAVANESLPLFLDSVGLPASVTIIISVVGVLIFGEIIPSAIFTGPDQLEIAARFAPLVSAVQFVLGFIAVPIAKTLDYLLGHEHKGRYNKAELKALLNLQTILAAGEGYDDERSGANSKETPSKDNSRFAAMHNAMGMDAWRGKASPMPGQNMLSEEERNKVRNLKKDEAMIMHGALELSKRVVADCMVSMEAVSMLNENTELSIDVLAEIVGMGHSRLPVYAGNPHNIRGMLMVKNLIVVNPEENRPVRQLGLRKPLAVALDYPLLDLLNDFQTGKSHMAIVTNNPS